MNDSQLERRLEIVEANQLKMTQFIGSAIEKDKALTEALTRLNNHLAKMEVQADDIRDTAMKAKEKVDRIYWIGGLVIGFSVVVPNIKDILLFFLE